MVHKTTYQVPGGLQTAYKLHTIEKCMSDQVPQDSRLGKQTRTAGLAKEGEREEGGERV